MFSFQHIEYFFALLAIPVMVFMYYRAVGRKKKTIKNMGDERLVHEMIRDYSPRRFALKFALIAVSFILTVFALCDLRSPSGTEKVKRNGVDLMIAIDVSKSMLAKDIKPSRLERAKQLIARLIDKLSNDRIGIVVFAGRAYLQMPLTADHGAAKMYLSAASPDVVPTQGTVIADALQMCQSSFNTREKKYKSVVLISDGEDHDEGALKKASQMANEGIIINTIGIGSPEGSAIIDETTNEIKKDIEGNTVITKLNEGELRDIAVRGNGVYQLFVNIEDVVARLKSQLDSMDQRTVTEDSLVNYRHYFMWFLFIALVLLTLEITVPEKRKISRSQLFIGSGKKASLSFFQVMFSMAFCLAPISSFSQNEKGLIKKGNEAYIKKEYDKAIGNYKEVTEKNPSNAIAQYNLGNALYKSNKADESVNAFENAVNSSHSTDEKSRSFYNKGVVLQNNKKIPECIDAYKNALKLNPEDEDARQNLQKALVQQKKQKEKENKEKKKPKEDQKQQDKKKPDEEDKKDQPKPQPSRLTKQDAEEKLKALLQQEKNLQDKLKKVNAPSLSKPEKDW